MILPGKSLRTQLIALSFGLTAIAVLIVSFLGIRAIIDSGNQARAIALTAAQERAQQLLVQTANTTASKNSVIFQNIQRQTENAATYTQNIFLNPGNFPNTSWRFDGHVLKRPAGNWSNDESEKSSIFIQSTLPITQDIKREMELTSYLDYVFPQVLKNEPNAVALYFEGPKGETRYYPNIRLEKLVPPDYDSTKGEYFVVASPGHNPDGSFKWSKVYNDPAGNGLTITAAQAMYGPSKNFLGLIDMDISLTAIAKNIESYSPLETSYAFLVDNAGRAIALPAQGYKDLLGRTSKSNEFGSDLQNVSGDFGSILHQMRSGKTGFQRANVNGEGIYVAFAPVEGTPFSLAVTARESAALTVVGRLQDQVQTSTNRVLVQIIMAAAVILAIAWVGVRYFVQYITDPIKQLIDKTSLIARGNLNVDPAVVRAGNEVAALATAFNTMIIKLRRSHHKIQEQNQALLHNEQARLEASINSLRSGFIMTDTKGGLLMINPAAQVMLAGRGKQVHEWNIDLIATYFGDTYDIRSKLKKAMRTKQPVVSKEIEVGEHILHICISPIQDPNGKSDLGVVILFDDITQAKLLERSKDEFFSIASHELRTPLTAVRGNSALIQQLYAPQLNDKDFDGMIGDIHGASVRLIEIVNDFLDASRLEQGRIKYDKQVFDIYEILQAVATEIAIVAKEKGNKVEIVGKPQSLPMVYADRNRVKQIVYNLVGNAMKFTERGVITIEPIIEGAKMQILVRDTGPGISSKDQRLLFRKFQQAKNTLKTREARGTGLGLYISKLLTEQMGGRISLEHSEIGHGTTFSFTLPLADDTHGGAREKAEQ